MSRELYIGNLSFAATEDDIRKLFSVSGTVVNLHLIKDPVSGLSKGCGYVRMANEKQARAAINDLDGARLIDRQITVSIARPHKPANPAERSIKSTGKQPAPVAKTLGRRKKSGQR